MPAGEAVTESSNISGGGSDSTCRVRVSLASKELTLTSIDQPHREQRYKVTRMRCWRITTLHTVSIIKFYIVALKVLYTCKFTEREYRLLVCCLPVVSTFIVFVTHSLTSRSLTLKLRRKLPVSFFLFGSTTTLRLWPI